MEKTKQISKFVVKRLSQQAQLPKKGSPGAAGYDIFSIEDTVVPAHDKAKVCTGLSWIVPKNTYGRIAPRSGLAWKHYLQVGAGVIDEDYRGEVCVILFNHSTQDFVVHKNDRIAQVIIERIEETELVEVDALNETSRGQMGFGSTGIAETMNSANNNTFNNATTNNTTNGKLDTAIDNEQNQQCHKSESQNVLACLVITTD